MGYPINKKYALASAEGAPGKATHKYIVVHDTGNDNNKAPGSGAREASYMKGHWRDAYTHFIVDDQAIYQVGTPGYVAWGAGSNANANSPLQVELAHVDSKARFNESYKRYIWLIRYYSKKYGIPLTLDTGAAGTAGVKSHKWVSDHLWGDHQDPYGYLAKWGISKAQFAKDIKNGLKEFGAKVIKKNVDYIQFEPKKLLAKTTVRAYKTTAMAKVTKTYHKGDVISVGKMYVRSTGSTAFKSDAGWVTGKKAWVSNYYYVDRDIKQIKTLKTVSTYKDANLKTKVGNAKPGVYTVAKVVKRSNGYWSFLLKSGLYISTRKDLTKKLK